MESFLKMYQHLSKDNLHLLKDMYREDIEFVDPAHRICGIKALTGYFASLYGGIDSINFSFAEPMVRENSGYVRWEMRFSHKRIAGGTLVTVEGATFVKIDDDGKVYFHRDYFDLGALVYEHVPLIGTLIKTIKKRLGA